MIHCEKHESVLVLRMEHGKVQAIDLDLMEALMDELNKALAAADTAAVVLTGTGRAFSAGVDLFRLLDGGPNYIREFLSTFHRFFRQLFMFPKPLIAAINGHAIAGGCLLACACDSRIMATGQSTVGLTELQVGVPMPALGLEIVRFACAPQYLQEILYTGKTFTPEEAQQRGLVDHLAPPDRLTERAQETAAAFGACPSDSFALMKHQMRKPALDRAESSPREDEVLRIWQSPDVHMVIRAYLNRTISKKPS